MAKTLIKRSQIDVLNIVDADIATGANIATSKLADGGEFLKRDGSITWTGNANAGSNRLTNLGAPVNPNDAARLVDVQDAKNGMDFKDSVRVATTANITLSGTQTIDGVSAAVGNRVLVKNQTTASENGIWVVAAGSWSRATDADSSTEVTSGMYTFVEEGTDNAGSSWVLSTVGPIVVGTTNLVFVQFSGAGQITVTGGLVKTGNQLRVATASSSRIVINANDIDLAQTGVTPGAYTKVTVDAYGRVNSGGSADPDDIGAQWQNDLLDAIAGLGANGFIVRTSGSSAAARTISVASTSRLTISNGDGVGGNPTLDLATTGVGAGTYNGIQVDTYGRVVAATDNGYFNAGSFVNKETPSGLVNGSNTVFNLANAPITDKEMVFLNGVLQESGGTNDYTISGTTITFVTAPEVGDKIRVSYFK